MSGQSSPALRRFLAAAGDALRRGDIAAAMNYSEQAVSQGFEEPSLLTLAGQWRLRHGQPERAFTVLSRAREIVPDNIEALNALGVSLAMLNRPAEAVAVFDDALARSPGTTYLRLHRSQPLENVGRLRDAQADLEQVLAAQPSNVHALERMANLCARRGDMVAARSFAERALKLSKSPSASIALAMAEIADGNYDAARALMAPLAAETRAGAATQSIALGLIGDALDALNRPAEAFASYTAAREILRTAVSANFEGKESAVARVRRLADYFRSAPPDAWRARPGSAPSGPVATHVFLVGFPRSGTTLLEQALASHGEVRTMEEVDCLGDVAGEYFYAADGMERFAALDADGLAALRAAYWQRVAAAGGQTDRRVFVDKMPLNSVHLGLIARLFPDARIIFALRDPRDVVLSCFRRRLVMSAHMYELARLDGAAAFYDAVMGLTELYRGALDLPMLDLKNEDVIADFDREMRRVCDFLGIGWDDGVRDFAQHARDRDIKTPSAMQVVRGLNKDGAGQWRRFRNELAPILPVLAPWARRFGYPEA